MGDFKNVRKKKVFADESIVWYRGRSVPIEKDFGVGVMPQWRRGGLRQVHL